jgi:hypothetical protein
VSVGSGRRVGGAGVDAGEVTAGGGGVTVVDSVIVGGGADSSGGRLGGGLGVMVAGSVMVGGGADSSDGRLGGGLNVAVVGAMVGAVVREVVGAAGAAMDPQAVTPVPTPVQAQVAAVCPDALVSVAVSPSSSQM